MESADCHQPQIVKVLDPRLCVNRSRDYVSQVGPKDSTYQVITASSSTSLSNISFSEQLSEQFFLSRKMAVRYSVQIVGTGSSAPLVYPTDIAPAAFPLQRCANSCNLSLNGTSFDLVPNITLPAMQRCIDGGDLAKHMSACPVQPDPYRYALKANHGANIGPFATMGAGGKSDAHPESRGAMRLTSQSNATNTSTIVMEFTEPLIISPLEYGDDEFAFSGVQTLRLNINTSNVERMFSYSNTSNTVSSVTVTLVSAPELLVTVMTPQEIAMESSYLPQMTKFYPLHRVNSIPLALPASIADAAESTVSNSLRISSVPSRVFVYMMKDPSLSDITEADVFLRIKSVSIQYGNTSGLLSQATPQQLYEISVKNGYKGTWNDWYTYSGSVLILDPAQDLGLDINSGLASGVMSPMNFYCKVTYENQLGSLQYLGASSYALTNAKLYITYVESGYLAVDDTKFTQYVGGLTQSEVLGAPMVDSAHGQLNQPNTRMYGGGLFSKLKSAFNFVKDKVLPVVRAVAPTIAPLVAQYSPGAAAALTTAASIGGVRGGRLSREEVLKLYRR